MTQTQTKSKSNVTAMTSTEESPSFKRKRMKEVRTMVARAVKNNQRVDLMGFEGTDVPRAMIALQDLLSKTKERHQKATNHLAQANNMGDMFAMVMNHATHNVMAHQEHISELSQALLSERADHLETAVALQETWQAAQGLSDDLQTVKRADSILNG